MKPTILYGVLNWGLGHASRSVPVIRSLVEIGYDVVIASDGTALKLLREEFPHLSYVTITGYNIRYPFRSIILNIMYNSLNIIKGIVSEKMKITQLMQKYKPQFIISDNRYGFQSNKAKSIMICHQTTLHHKNSIVSRCANMINRFLLRRFDEIWIPDFSGSSSLAGKLSYCSFPVKHFYIGPLSRLKTENHQKEYDIAIILSGPEPQRTHLEKLLIEGLKNTDYRGILVRGVIEEQEKTDFINDLAIIDYANAAELNRILNSSELLIARSGYSTIMDVVALGIKAVFIPTPGQTEQEYLAQYLKDKGFFFSMEQSRFDLKHALKESEKYAFSICDNPELAVKIREILQKSI